jgi:hypothetical protein
MDGTVIITAVLVSVLGAWFSYRFVEKKVLDQTLSRSLVFVGGGTVIASTVLIGGLLIVSGGLPQRFSPESKRFLSLSKDVNQKRRQCHNNFTHEFMYGESCVFGDARAAPTIAIWADSFGTELSAALGKRSSITGASVRELTASACPPSLGYATPSRPECLLHNQRMLEGLRTDQRIRTVVLAANYTMYPVAERPVMLAGLRDAVETLQRNGKRIVLVYPIPHLPFPGPRGLAILRQRGESLDRLGVDRTEFQAETAAIVQDLDRLAGDSHAQTIRPIKILCPTQRCRAFAEGQSLYFDAVHLSMAGADLLLKYEAQSAGL